MEVTSVPNLPKLTLSHDKTKGNWPLKHDGSGTKVKSFETKASAVKGGALAKALGQAGGSVKIKGMDGKIQEERTYPRSADPKKSKG